LIKLSVPIIYSLEITPICSNHCLACSSVFHQNTLYLSALQWQKAILDLSPHVEILKLTGGEPTLHPEFTDIIHTISKMNIKFTIFTNGRWAKPQAIIDLLKASPQCGGLLISLHGTDAITHEKFTNTSGSFEETCENIHRATAAGLRVHISTVLTQHNYHQIKEIVSFSKKLGVKRVVINRCIGRYLPDFSPDQWQIKQAIRDIETLKQSTTRNQSSQIKYGNCFPQCFTPNSSTGCWAGIASCTIDPWGNLRPCNHSPTIAGNVLEDPIEKIWHNEIMNKWRAMLPEQCGNCAELETCHGGCRAQAEILGMSNDPLMRQAIPAKSDQKPPELDLYENSYPLLECTIRTEPFGYALIHGHALLPVTFAAKSILDQLDGRRTLKQLQHTMGQDALDFIGTLYVHGLLSLGILSHQ